MLYHVSFFSSNLSNELRLEWFDFLVNKHVQAERSFRLFLMRCILHVSFCLDRLQHVSWPIFRTPPEGLTTATKQRKPSGLKAGSILRAQ